MEGDISWLVWTVRLRCPWTPCIAAGQLNASAEAENTFWEVTEQAELKGHFCHGALLTVMPICGMVHHVKHSVLCSLGCFYQLQLKLSLYAEEG